VSTDVIKVIVDGHEASVKIESSGWFRRKSEVEYDLSEIPTELRRMAYSTLINHVRAKIKKRDFTFHFHFGFIS